jgi:S-adenosylmethionine:tRNA ribosyltransferase-isomerase
MHPQINLEDFQYKLPEERIAQHPLANRDEAKLLIYDKGEITHSQFFKLPLFLSPQTLLVFNDTKVIPARLYFRKETRALIEIFLVEPAQPALMSLMTQATSPVRWHCMIGNKKRWKNGEILKQELLIGEVLFVLEAVLIDAENQIVELRWSEDELPFLEILQKFGNLPLPPYLKRKVSTEDQNQYQTVYSANEGAVAAPTAGLHFTERVLDDLDKKGIEKLFLTLHVGGGTFQPIKTDSIVEHKMHLEQIIFTKENIQQLRKNTEHVIAVGTTSMRALESLYWFGIKVKQAKEEGNKAPIPFFIEKLYPYQLEKKDIISLDESLEMIEEYMYKHNLLELPGETEIFIFTGYIFKVCKSLITNYHLPNTTLILLVAAFIGEDWRKVYEQALAHEYRFLSYGDSSLLIPSDGV